MTIAELSAQANDTYIGGNFNLIWREAGDALGQCGQVVETEATTVGEVIICSTDGFPLAVCALQAEIDIDTIFASGTMNAYYLLHSATMLRVAHDTNADATVGGEQMGRSETVAGMINTGATLEDNELVGWTLGILAAAADVYVSLVT